MTDTPKHEGNPMNKMWLSLMTLVALVGASAAGAQTPLGYVAIAPCRVVDTRYAPSGILQATVARSFKVRDTSFTAQGGGGVTCNVPDSAKAVIVNITAT